MSSLFSSSWYRMTDLVPRLRSQAKIYRHVYRGDVWHVVQDLGSGKFLRLNPGAYRVLCLMDGWRNLDRIWALACEQMGDGAPSQDEVLQLMSQLHNIGVLLTNRKPDLDELHHRTRQNRKNRIKQYISNPLALRIPLLDPDRFLQWLVDRIPDWSRPLLLLLWLGMLLFGGSLALTHWEALTGDITRLVFTSEYIVTLILVFPLIKAVHELSHGIAIKLFGGQCHEMGVMLLILMPVPYVDASHATAFISKRRRMLVGAAGMMGELLVASIALWFWTWAQPGLARVFLHDVVILAGVVTIVFNLNPLLRFDGYYILSDWLEIPNLGSKANQYFGYLFRRHLLRIRKGLQPPRTTPREPAWLVSYAVLSFFYRMSIVATIILFVATQFFFIGVLLALWAIYLMLLVPLSKTVRGILSDPLISERRPRLYSVTALLLIGLVWLLGIKPFPAATQVEGVVWMADHSHLRVDNACFGEQLLSAPGRVVQGQPLLYCADPQLQTRQRVIQARRRELQAERILALDSDRVRAQLVQDELDNLQRRIRDLEQRIAAFTLKSPHDGEFVLPAAQDYTGRWFKRGQVVGYVLDPRRFTLLAAVPQVGIDRVRSDSRAVRMRPVGDVHVEYPLRVLRAVPSATRELPSLALSLQGGGEIGLTPNSDPPLAMDPLFLIELGGERPEIFGRALGSRVYIRFEHTPEPLAMQGYRVVRDVFMRRFGV